MACLNDQYMAPSGAVACILLYIALVYLNYVTYMRRREIVSQPLLVTVLMMIGVAMLPVVLLIIALFWITRQLVRVFLVVKLGSRFGGLFSGADAIHLLKGANRSIVSVLMTIKYDNRRGVDFHDYMTEILHKIFSEQLARNHKIRGAVGRCFGYSYLIRNEVSFEDWCKKLKRIDDSSNDISRNDLMKIIGERTNVPLPKNGLWEILIGTQRLKSKENDIYPIVMRYNHSLMDGESTINLILTCFGDKKIKTEDVSLPTITLLQKLKLPIKELLWNIMVFSLLPACIIAQAHKKSELTVLNKPKLLNKTMVSFKTEESPRYIKIIKEIKNRVEGSTISDIVLTAFCASLHEWLQKNYSVAPKCIVVGMTSSPKIMSLAKSQTFQADINLRNRFTMYSPVLPLPLTDKKTRKASPIEQLRLVKYQTQLIRSTLDGEVNYSIIKILGGIFTSWFTNLIMKYLTCDVLYSNLLMVQPITVFGGYPLYEWLAFLALRERTGLALLFGTYDQRIQVSLTMDATLISDQKDVNEILNGIFPYLDLLFNEVTGN